jgi:phage gp46-like protein
MPTDVRLKQTFDPAGVFMDFVLKSDGTLDETEELATAVRVALGTDALVGPEDVLPDPDSTDRRGWWGDMDADLVWDGWPIGCKNWLLTRAKITDVTDSEGDTLERARIYTLEAIKPMIDRRVASRVSVVAERTELERIDVHATIFRGPKFEIDLRYQLLWEDDPYQIAPYVPYVAALMMVPSAFMWLVGVTPRTNRLTPSTAALTLGYGPSFVPSLVAATVIVKSPATASLISTEAAPTAAVASIPPIALQTPAGALAISTAAPSAFAATQFVGTAQFVLTMNNPTTS